MKLTARINFIDSLGKAYLHLFIMNLLNIWCNSLDGGWALTQDLYLHREQHNTETQTYFDQLAFEPTAFEGSRPSPEIARLVLDITVFTNLIVAVQAVEHRPGTVPHSGCPAQSSGNSFGGLGSRSVSYTGVPPSISVSPDSYRSTNPPY